MALSPGDFASLRSNARFREALAWQNRSMLGVLDRLAVGPPPANAEDRKRRRKRERAIALYVQRYAAKNDTIGFFGPIAWLELGRTEQTSGHLSHELASRTVRFEHWAADAIARSIGSDPLLKRCLAPKHIGTIRIEGSTLIHPIERRSPISQVQARILQRCDGTRTAAAIAVEISVPEQAVLSTLDAFQKAGLVTFGPEVPTEVSDPFAHLAGMIEAVGDPAARDAAGAVLARFEALRASVAAAHGSDRLVPALEALDEAFALRTGQAAARRPGQIYAGRSLVYEDCRIDPPVSIGRDIVDRIRTPLSLVLESARWFTHAIASRLVGRLSEIHASLATATGSDTVDGIRFLEQAETCFPASQRDLSPIVAEARDDLVSRWASILACGAGDHRVVRRSSDITAAVERAFAAPGPGWPLARYHSPDLMIAAESEPALREGRFTIVLGELHPGTNLLLGLHALDAHPNPNELFDARRREVPPPLISPVIPASGYHRAASRSPVPEDLHCELGRARSWRAPDRMVRAADLVVTEGPTLRTRDGRWSFDAPSFFEHHLARSALHFAILPSAPHVPRVAIDDLILTRESWTFAPEALTRIRSTEDASSFAFDHGIPRFVFASVPEEPKPVYIDLQGPIYVDILARFAQRAAGPIRLSEMLPAHDALWLADASGSRYTCELRICAVDPRPYSGMT
jgi:hypothetical protein